MRIGTHVSIAKGIWNAPGNAAKVGAEVFQIFSRSPHGGPVQEITPEVQKKFRDEMEKNHFDTFYIHAPYFINFSSIKGNIYYGSISVVRQELERGTLLGCKAIMTHLGSFGELTDEEGIERQVKAIAKVMEGYNGTTQLLLEISAGAGRVVGDTFEELAWILDDERLKNFNIGVCLDSCHLAGFEAMLAHKVLGKLDWILETPKDDPKDDPKNIAILKKMRN
jgi:deoxyribonuclease-4